MSRLPGLAAGLARRGVNSVSARCGTLWAATRDLCTTTTIDTSPEACSCYIDQPPHGLPRHLVVSLTSHGGRFSTLHRTLASLLMQTIRPDALILWVAREAVDALPSQVVELKRFGLEVRGVRDLGPHTKLVHALAAFPDGYIVTADDDAYYEPTWLHNLVQAHDADHESILFRRGHRISLRDDGTLAPYRDWDWDVQDQVAFRASADLFPTGVGGVLYPPGSLHPLVGDEDAFRALCPGNDDIWFNWMARLAGTMARKVGPRFAGISWPGTQASGLSRDNLRTRNDEYFRAMAAHFGPLHFNRPQAPAPHAAPTPARR